MSHWAEAGARQDLPKGSSEVAVLTAGSDIWCLYVTDRNDARSGTPGLTSTKVAQFAGVLPHWAETFDSRPKTTRNYTYSMTVYRLTAS